MDKILLLVVCLSLFAYVTFEIIRGRAGRKRRQ